MRLPFAPRERAGLIACTLLVALAVAVRLIYGPNIRDDAYITLRYAANLASGYGFVYNPGEAVLGTSTPLYTLFLAGLKAAGLDPIGAAVALGVMSDAAAIVLVFLLVWREDRWVPALVAGLGYALWLPLVSYAVSGMETPLYTALILATVLAYVRGRLNTVGAFAGLAAFLRPDGAILPLAIAGYHIWRRNRVPIKPIVVFMLGLLPWVAFSTLYFGSPVPNSVPAKLHYGSMDPLLSVRNLLNYFSSTEGAWLLPASLLAALGLRRYWRAGTGLRILLVWAVLYVLAFTAANKFLYPDWPFEWYFVPLLLPLALSAGYGIEELLAHTRAGAAVIRPGLAALALVGFGGFYGLIAYQGNSIVRMFVDGREGLYAKIAARLADYGATEAVAAPEIGTLGYFYPGPILDLEGLVSPRVINLGYAGALREYRTPWLVSWNTLVPEDLRAEPWFDAEYRPVFVLPNWEGRQAILYRRYPASPLDGSRQLMLGESLRLNGLTAEVSPQATGSLVRVRLDWELLGAVDSRYTVFVHVLDGSGNRVAQQDNEPQEGTRALDATPPGHLADLYDLRVPEGVDLARAQVSLGAYRLKDPAVHLSWSTKGGSLLGPELQAPLVPIREDQIEAAKTFTDCRAEFAASIELAGYSLDGTPQNGRRLALLWKGLESMSQDYTVFVHALDGQGRIAGQFDGQPAGGRYPTSMWLRDEVVLDQRDLPPLSQEIAALRVGLYHLPEGRRLPVNRPSAGDSVVIDMERGVCRVSGP